jgi:ABC-2 type transport system ATP-binding protein
MNPSSRNVARLCGISKRYRQREALRDFDLELRSGELLALIGPNGAGKTTAVSILSGLRVPDSGTAELLGGDPRKAETRRNLGLTPQELDFPGALTVREILEFVSAHYRHPRPIAATLDAFELNHLAKRAAGGLSVGERRRLAIAVAFAGNPAVAILDEPTTGLDVESRRAAWKTLRAYVDDGGSALLCTHYLEEAEALADRVVIIDRGRAIFSGPVEAVRARVGRKRVRFNSATPPRVAGATVIAHDADRYTLETADVDSVVRQLVAGGVDFKNVEIVPLSLEDAFLALTEKAS